MFEWQACIRAGHHAARGMQPSFEPAFSDDEDLERSGAAETTAAGIKAAPLLMTHLPEGDDAGVQEAAGPDALGIAAPGQSDHSLLCGQGLLSLALRLMRACRDMSTAYWAPAAQWNAYGLPAWEASTAVFCPGISQMHAPLGETLKPADQTCSDELGTERP